MPSRNKRVSSKKKRKYTKRRYKGGNTPQQIPQQIPQQPVPQQAPPQIGVIKPAPVSQNQLRSFPKKIRLNVSADFKSTIEAPQEAEYILAERLNAAQKYGNPDVYISQFGNDEETGSPIDVYTDYVYERLKDLKLPSCQQLKHRGDKAVEGGVFTAASSRRQQCAADLKTLKQEDNKILQAWVENIKKQGVGFLESVAGKIEELTQKIADLQATKKEKEGELKDATNTMQQNLKGIEREMAQRFQEITRIMTDREENEGFSEKINAEVADLQNYIREETGIAVEIETIDKAIGELVKQIEDTQKQLLKIQNGLTKVNAQLTEQGIDLQKLMQEVEKSIAMYAMAGGRRRRKYSRKSKKSSKKRSRKKRSRKKQKGGSIIGSAKKVVRKMTSKRALAAAVGAAAGVAVMAGGKRKRGGNLKRQKPVSSYEAASFGRAYKKSKTPKKTIAQIRKENDELEEKMRKIKMRHRGGRKSKK